MNDYKTRFSSAPWANVSKDIVIGGAGGISSWIALSLARAGHKLYIYDMDTYDETNIAGQFCKIADVGVNKSIALAENILNYDMDTYDETNIAGQFCKIADVGVNKSIALAENILNFTGAIVETHDKYVANSLVAPYMITGFDNMESRKLMYDKWKSQPKRELFLDARMTGEFLEVYCIIKGREEYYESTLFTDDEANVLPCSFKATTHNAMGCAYILQGLLNNYIVGDYKSGLRELPCHVRFDIGIMMFEVN